MNYSKINNIFSQSDLDCFIEKINDLIIPTNKDGSYIYDESNNTSISKNLGRVQSSDLMKDIHTGICEKLIDIAGKHLDFDVSLSGITYVEYNSLYGTPNLPPHFDGDSTDLIINCQLFSNTSWDIGLGTKTYSLDDNSALLFNPNTNIHWRPHKKFMDGEYIKMIFVRFCRADGKSDYSNLRYSQDHEVFKEVVAIRDGSPTGT